MAEKLTVGPVFEVGGYSLTSPDSPLKKSGGSYQSFSADVNIPLGDLPVDGLTHSINLQAGYLHTGSNPGSTANNLKPSAADIYSGPSNGGEAPAKIPCDLNGDGYQAPDEVCETETTVESQTLQPFDSRMNGNGFRLRALWAVEVPLPIAGLSFNAGVGPQLDLIGYGENSRTLLDYSRNGLEPVRPDFSWSAGGVLSAGATAYLTDSVAAKFSLFGSYSAGTISFFKADGQHGESQLFGSGAFGASATVYFGKHGRETLSLGNVPSATNINVAR